MTITFGHQMIPITLTALIAMTAMFWPLPKNTGGMFGHVGAVIAAVVHFTLGVLAIMAVWLVYLTCLVWAR